MRAVTWHGRRDIRVEDVPDPVIRADDDAIVEVTTTGLCGSDLHLYEVLGPFMSPGDVLGHETMGTVVEVGSAVGRLAVGDRVVVPFQIACGRCFMCERGLQTQCETTQVRSEGTGAALFGYSWLYGGVPGGQAEYLRVPHADYGPVVVSGDHPDERYVYLSDVMPTAWQGVEYAGVREGDTLAIVGLGPIGDMAGRLARHRRVRVIGFDFVPERVARARERGVEAFDVSSQDPVETVLSLTAGRGADGVLEAVGMEAHGSPATAIAHRATAHLPSALGRAVMQHVSMDRMAALTTAFSLVRRRGTVSICGVYAGTLDPMPMQQLFDRQVTLRMGQANVRRWIDDLLPLAEASGAPLGLEQFATHRTGIEDAPGAYTQFQQKAGGMVKVLFDLSKAAR